MLPVPAPLPLSGRCVVSLRPVGGHAGLRRAARALGARVLALSPYRLDTLDDEGLPAQLARAMRADVIVFTSPAAVASSLRLTALQARRGQAWVAVGAGTARALRRAGIRGVHAPAARMDSEGLLALPVLDGLDGREVALVTAPGGRGLIAPALAARGARVQRVEVYARVPVAPSPRALARLRALDSPPLLALSSGEALHLLLGAVPDDIADILRGGCVLAASARLAALARAHGFAQACIASDARPTSLLAAAAACQDLPTCSPAIPSHGP